MQDLTNRLKLADDTISVQTKDIEQLKSEIEKLKAKIIQLEKNKEDLIKTNKGRLSINTIL